MDDETEAGPSRTGTRNDPSGQAPVNAAGQRAERLKAALRDNLRRRKAQSRGRSGRPESGQAPERDGDA
ncbi:hypothetical protein [Methylobacterium goesingense]|uniref:hypothetical protein n=1 Tax=Methylobacterium TaxID=407 RepID=UPI003D6EF276